MRYSKNFNRDYNFYISVIDTFNFAGKDVDKECNIVTTENAVTAKECFYNYDSSGIRDLDCNEVELIKKLIICKASVNMHIKMYAESMTEFTLTTYELKEILDEIKAPSWFYKSVMGQVEILFRKKVKNKTITYDTLIELY